MKDSVMQLADHLVRGHDPLALPSVWGVGVAARIPCEPGRLAGMEHVVRDMLLHLPGCLRGGPAGGAMFRMAHLADGSEWGSVLEADILLATANALGLARVTTGPQSRALVPRAHWTVLLDPEGEVSLDVRLPNEEELRTLDMLRVRGAGDVQ